MSSDNFSSSLSRVKTPLEQTLRSKHAKWDMQTISFGNATLKPYGQIMHPAISCERERDIFLCQAPWARSCYLCCWWEAGVGVVACFHPHTLQSKGKGAAGAAAAPWCCLGKRSEMQLCICAVPQQAPVLENFAELFFINSSHKSTTMKQE